MFEEVLIEVVADDRHRVPTLWNDVPGAKFNVIFVHGLTGDRNEVSNLLKNAAVSIGSLPVCTCRFEFRGHGQSAMPSKDMTISGELKDLEAVVSFVREKNDLPILFVATSMGAVSAILYLSRCKPEDILGLVLWNPVLNPRATFVDPGTDWSREQFQIFRENPESDVLLLGDFELGRELWREFSDKALAQEVWGAITGLGLPILLMHGTSDQIVPYSISEELALLNNQVELVTYPKEIHGMTGVHEEMILESKKWMLKQFQT